MLGENKNMRQLSVRARARCYGIMLNTTTDGTDGDVHTTRMHIQHPVAWKKINYTLARRSSAAAWRRSGRVVSFYPESDRTNSGDGDAPATVGESGEIIRYVRSGGGECSVFRVYVYKDSQQQKTAAV